MDLYGPEGLERQTRVKNNIRGVIRNLVPLYFIFQVFSNLSELKLTHAQYEEVYKKEGPIREKYLKDNSDSISEVEKMML